MRKLIKTIKRAAQAIHHSRRLDRAFKRYLDDADHADGIEGVFGPEHRRQAWRVLGLAIAAFMSMC
jgi:hypothetical protein